MSAINWGSIFEAKPRANPVYGRCDVCGRRGHKVRQSARVFLTTFRAPGSVAVFVGHCWALCDYCLDDTPEGEHLARLMCTAGA